MATTLRPDIKKGEELKIGVSVLRQGACDETVKLNYRDLGDADFESVDMARTEGSIGCNFVASLTSKTVDFEWFVSAGDDLVFPSGAPAEQTVTVVVL